MIGIVLLLIQTCAYLVNAGGSGSAEAQAAAAAAANPGTMTGGVGAEGANPGLLNNLLINGQLAQLVPVSQVPQTFLLQQPGLPFGQVNVPVGSNMGLQQGVANTQLYALVPANGFGGQQIPGLQMFNPAQQFQLVPVGGRNMMLPGMGAQTAAAGHDGHTVKQRSVPDEPNAETTLTEDASAMVEWPSSLAKALKLPPFPSKVNSVDPNCTENVPAISEEETETMEESSGLAETWS